MSDDFLNSLNCSELVDFSFELRGAYWKKCSKFMRNGSVLPKYMAEFKDLNRRYVYHRQRIDEEFERKLKRK